MAANEHQQKEQQESREPAHHARRPMNAFLIFCKRHRGSVRTGFPHLENRAVTRVLGEWWATLNPDQKRSYTNLAQEYKDAFLNANPDFKWYKLPAPPLRTLSTRPTNKKSEAGSSDMSPDEMKEENSSLDFSESERTDGEAIQPGKLADESQIGGLSSLFTPQKVQSTDNDEIVNHSTPKIETENNSTPKPPKKRYIELPLSVEQKEECKVDLFGDKNKTRKESNNNHQTEMDEGRNEGNSYFDDSNAEEQNFRGERTCKGLRYQKFLAEQQRNFNSSTQPNKRRKISGTRSVPERTEGRRNSISSNVSEKTDSLSSEGNSSRGDLEHLVESAEGNIEASKPEETETEGAEGEMDFGPWSHKRFRAEDFNLEKKIEALPSLSLEEFQEKKKQQRTKKKKILLKGNSNSSNKKNFDNLPSGNDSSNQNNQKHLRPSDELLKEEEKNLVGSQKRKARKQNITRNAALTTLSKQNNDQDPSKSWCASPDLEALACLATVAANRTKLTKS
ncbi:putative uncharacterized protein DDB_G0274435 [Leptopilina boulardi]|uniref:putative uncharacterized protein DDB_G0274435 n=1 Tax=Leptopilina boulardi TaxID=63433 RepID=UPI0021F51526|nr:putative uncharacterized protein DDB_G0274435 [Leptopilina boulardi]